MSKLLEHFKAMQAVCGRYLEPEPLYEDRDGMIYKTDEGHKDGFIGDMIYMLDGPEQREAQAEAQSMADQGYPTEHAYMAACRALHWRNEQLRQAGIEPMDLHKADPVAQFHYPPDWFRFPVTRQIYHAVRRFPRAMFATAFLMLMTGFALGMLVMVFR